MHFTNCAAHIEAIRAHVEAEGTKDSGWFAGLSDPVIGRDMSRFMQELGMTGL